MKIKQMNRVLLLGAIAISTAVAFSSCGSKSNGEPKTDNNSNNNNNGGTTTPTAKVDYKGTWNVESITFDPASVTVDGKAVDVKTIFFGSSTLFNLGGDLKQIVFDAGQATFKNDSKSDVRKIELDETSGLMKIDLKMPGATGLHPLGTFSNPASGKMQIATAAMPKVMFTMIAQGLFTAIGKATTTTDKGEIVYNEGFNETIVNAMKAEAAQMQAIADKLPDNPKDGGLKLTIVGKK